MCVDDWLGVRSSADDAPAVGADVDDAPACALGVTAAFVFAGVADDFAAARGDLLCWARADGRATLPLAVLTTPIVADAAASALPVPTCAVLLRLTGCATSPSWAAWGLPWPAKP